MKNIIKEFKKIFPSLNQDQIDAISTTDGPLLIIAGPGTGKTLTLILRTLYIILSGKAKPEEVVLTTFTEKAAYEIRDRIYQTAERIGYLEAINNIKINTIHGLCNDFILENLSYTKLKKGYKILDEISQMLFLNESFNEIFPQENGLYLGKWASKWLTIQESVAYLNKITEEMIELERLENQNNNFLRLLAKAYRAYQNKLFEINKIDFANLQMVFYNLLNHREVYPKIKSKIKYIMVDEYQDTNYIQEQILLKLAYPQNNLCVVGDEDQALYRFRGATVRNILEFPEHFKNCQMITLTINYRSHKDIIDRYNHFIQSIDWGKYRFEKYIIPDPNQRFSRYPAVFTIQEDDEDEEAERFVDLIRRLKNNNVIEDYSDVALILKSVRQNHSNHYIAALKRHGIPYFCPRAKRFFENEEIQLMVACFAIILGFYQDEDLNNYNHANLIYNSMEMLYNYFQNNPDDSLVEFIRNRSNEIEELQKGSLNITVLDIFYELLSYEPFSNYLQDKNSAYNFSIFSKLISLFQEYHGYSVITANNKIPIRLHFFYSFLNFLINKGIDEFEDMYNPIPKGYVQIMTIHQSKGLEFPVVFVGSLNRNFTVQKEVDRLLQPFSKRGTYETEQQMTQFDRLRHYYVAFSRAKNLLVLTTTNKVKNWFLPIWDGLPRFPYLRLSSLLSMKFSSKPHFVPKKSYFVSDIHLFENCPQQFKFYREFNFEPSRSSLLFFVELVKITIDDIHRAVITKKKFIEDDIIDWLDQNYETLLKKGLRPISQTDKDTALRQVFNYYIQNDDIIHNISALNFHLSFERDQYLLKGNIDLLVNRNGNLEIVDFKVQKRQPLNHPLVQKYINKLYLFAYILKHRYEKPIERIFIYWTSEKKRKDALMEIPYSEKEIKKILQYFDGIVGKIKKQKFRVETPPPSHICKDCDFKYYCSRQGIIDYDLKKEE